MPLLHPLEAGLLTPGQQAVPPVQYRFFSLIISLKVCFPPLPPDEEGEEPPPLFELPLLEGLYVELLPDGLIIS